MMPSKYRVFLLPFSFSGAVNVFRYHTGDVYKRQDVLVSVGDKVKSGAVLFTIE